MFNFLPYASLVLCVVPITEEIKRYFSLRSLLSSALLNFALVCHILFVEEKLNEHIDSLYVALMGMTLSTICVFLWLLHWAVFERPILARFVVIIFI